MLDKNPEWLNDLIELLKQIGPYLMTILLSFFAGLVRHIQNVRNKGVGFSWRELAFDMVVASFVGLLTHLFCEYSGIEGPLRTMLIAISAHMGADALKNFEGLYNRIVGRKETDDAQR